MIRVLISVFLSIFTVLSSWVLLPWIATALPSTMPVSALAVNVYAQSVEPPVAHPIAAPADVPLMAVTSNAAAITSQTQAEAETIYLTNLEREKQGLAPLRWNRQLSESAQWFAWDTIENRADVYCGHTDSLGREVGDRAKAFEYLLRGPLGENAICGYASPGGAIAGWMNSAGHRQNILTGDYREVGLGYYQRSRDGRGYIVQNLAQDRFYAPVIIENERLTTETPTVELYIYDRVPNKRVFGGLAPATEMMIANEPTFAGARWEPFAIHKTWTLTAGTGWRTVYVMTRDALGRIMTAYDTIYLGSNMPVSELTLNHATAAYKQLTFRNLTSSVPVAGRGWNAAQFSLSWMADDNNGNFSLVTGQGEQLPDSDAVGGTALRLHGGSGNAYAWLWTTNFHKNLPMVAYLRAKVTDNAAGDEVLKVVLDGGGIEHTLSLRGTSFAQANQYQEFAIPFTAADDPNNPFLAIHFHSSGRTGIDIDGLTFFTASIPLQDEMTWRVPDEYYRGEGAWVRFAADNGTFSPRYDLPYHALNLPQPTTPLPIIYLESETIVLPPNTRMDDSTFVRTITCPICDNNSTWQVQSNSSWLTGMHQNGNQVRGRVDAANLTPGRYESEIAISITRDGEQAIIKVPVKLTIERVSTPAPQGNHQIFLPVALRSFTPPAQ